MKLSIIIPVFNEEKTIKQVLERVSKVKLTSNLKKEIIVVDDASTDKTKKVLSEVQIPNSKFQIYFHDKNYGKGAAIRTGLKHVTGDYIIIQDADLEYNPTYYSKLLEPFNNKEIVVVYGSRLVNYPLNLWGNKKTVLPLHLIANRFLTLLTNILYGGNLTDMETGYKVFRKKILDSIQIKSDKFDIEPEITAKILKQKIKILEIPIKTLPRTYQEGKKIGWKDGIAAIWALIKYKFVD